MNKFERAVLPMKPPKVFIAEQVETYGCTRAEAKKAYNKLHRDEVWLNDLYQVNIDRKFEIQPFEGVNVVHVSVKRRDRAPARDWRHLQQIKNELFGEDYEAVEVYPAQNRVIDVANQTHLWLFTDAANGSAICFPVGWLGKGSIDYESKGGAIQRPRETA